MITVSPLNTASSTTTTTPIFPPPATAQRSPWHSPWSYLFGGLSAMLCLCLIALALLICSFRIRRLSSENGERDLEAGNDEKAANSVKALPEFEEKYLVIMAGDVNPTFLATPVCSKVCSLEQDAKLRREKADYHIFPTTDRMATTTKEEGTKSESENRTQENPVNSMEQNH